MKNYTLFFYFFPLLYLMFFLNGCNITDNENEVDKTLSFKLSEDKEKWNHFFVNYSSLHDVETLEFDGGFRALPSPLDTSRQAYFITSNNVSDNVSMLIKGEVGNLEPFTTYGVQFRITFATNAPSDCGGIGGAPGDGVTVQAVMVEKEPKKVADPRSDDSKYYLLNLDKDSREEKGITWYPRTKIGNIANSRNCSEKRVYELKSLLSQENHWEFKTDQNGTAWLLFGTRSGFESVTSIYFTEVEIYLREK